jgi:hypothetical protein
MQTVVVTGKDDTIISQNNNINNNNYKTMKKQESIRIKKVFSFPLSSPLGLAVVVFFLFKFYQL